MGAWLLSAVADDACDTDVEIENDYVIAQLDLCTPSVTPVIWTATDECGNEETHTANLVIDGDEVAPMISVPASPLVLDCSSISETASPTIEILDWLAEATTSDACDVDPTLTNDFDMGVVDICAAADYSITVTWTSSDECGNSSTATQTIDITVDAGAPTATAPGDVIVE